MHCSRIRAAMGIRQSRQSNQVFLRGQKRAISEQFPPSGVYTLCSPHFPWATIERRVPQKKPGRRGLQFPIFRNRTWQKAALVSRKRKAIKTFTGEEDKKLFKRGGGWTDINALLALEGIMSKWPQIRLFCFVRPTSLHGNGETRQKDVKRAAGKVSSLEHSIRNEKDLPYSPLSHSCGPEMEIASGRGDSKHRFPGFRNIFPTKHSAFYCTEKARRSVGKWEVCERAAGN